MARRPGQALAPLPDGVPEMYRPPTPRQERRLRAWGARRAILVRSVIIASVASAAALSHLPGSTPRYDVRIPAPVIPSLAPFPTLPPFPSLRLPTITPSRLFPRVPAPGDVRMAGSGSVSCSTLPDPLVCQAAVDGQAFVGKDALVALIIEYADARTATAQRERVAVTPRIGLLPLNRTETLGRFVVSVSAEQGATTSPALLQTRDRLVGQIERRLRTLG